jgi:hypothetical protein
LHHPDHRPLLGAAEDRHQGVEDHRLVGGVHGVDPAVAHQVVGGPAPHLGQALVDPAQADPGVGEGDPDGRVGGQGPEPLLAGAQQLVGADLVGDLPHGEAPAAVG